jgi:hypothetical protein
VSCGFDGRKRQGREACVSLLGELQLLAGVFGIEGCGYSIMSNHLHVVLGIRPDRLGSGATRRSRTVGCTSIRRATKRALVPPSRKSTI